MVKPFHLHNLGSALAIHANPLLLSQNCPVLIPFNPLTNNSLAHRKKAFLWHPICSYRTSALVPKGLPVATEILKTKTKVDSSQQRRSPRLRLQVPVFLRGADASGIEFIELTKTLNISATGASIASTHMLRPDQVVHLTIPTPSPASSGLVPNETPPISARVLRQEMVGDMRVFGLEFLRALD